MAQTHDNTYLLAFAKDRLGAAKEAAATYARIVQGEVKEGRVFDDISSLLGSASSSIELAGARLAEAGTLGPLPVEQISHLLTAALGSLMRVAERAAAFDHEHHYSVKLYSSLEAGVETAQSAVSAVKDRISAASDSVREGVHSARDGISSAAETAGAALSGPLHAAGARVSTVAGSSAESLQHVYASLTDLLGHISTHQRSAQAAAGQPGAAVPAGGDALAAAGGAASAVAGAAHNALDNARALVSAAAEEVRRSLTQLQDAPLSEKPTVATLQVLHLARAAVAAVGSAVSTAAHRMDDTAAGAALHVAKEKAEGAASATLAALVAARERASAAVEAAAARLGTLPARVAATAASAATSATDYALRKAVTLDSSYCISDRLSSLNESYQVAARVTAAAGSVQAKAADIDQRYGVTEKVTAALDKAKGWDDSITGGKATAAAESALALGATAVAAAVGYAKEVATKYETLKQEARAADGAEGASPSATSPSGGAAGAAAAGGALNPATKVTTDLFVGQETQ